MRKSLVLVVVLAVAGFGQTATSQKQPTTIRRAPANQNSGVDAVIELVKRGASEALVIKTLQDQGTAYKLSISDLVKLQDAGVSENIINVMRDPKAPVKTQAVPLTASTSTPETVKDPLPGGAGAAPAPPPPAETVAVTPYPPNLQVASVARKRRLIIAPIDYDTVRQQVWYWFNRDENIGAGIRSMLETQVATSPNIALLERRNLDAMLSEQDFGKTNRAHQGRVPAIGKVSGADYFLVGDVVAFGTASTSKNTNAGVWESFIPTKKYLPRVGTINKLGKEDKALVKINYRIVDAETLEDVAAGSAEGESFHKTKELQAGLWGQGSVQSFGSSTMTSPEFQKNILGEATVDAVNKIAKQLEEKSVQIPLKPRKIEGRVAAVTANGVYLDVGDNKGVERGDRFEIRQITGEVLDPRTKEVIDVQTAKVGELMVNEVHEETAIGNYGGRPLSQEYCTGKGYQAILMSK